MDFMAFLAVYKLTNQSIYDAELQEVINCVLNGWPDLFPHHLKPYRDVLSGLSVIDGLLLYQHRIVIPHSERQGILGRLNENHEILFISWITLRILMLRNFQYCYTMV